MKVYSEISISEFDAWSGAKKTRDIIVYFDKEKEFDAMIEDLYPDGIDSTKLNDLLWFEDDWIYEILGINPDDYTEDEDDEN